MSEAFYLLFLIGALSYAVFFSHVQKLHIERYHKQIGLGYLIVSVPFIIWDFIATNNGHWSFNFDYVLGPKIGNLPFEEVLFFFVIPYVMTVVWLQVQKAVIERHLQLARQPFIVVSIISLLLGVLSSDKGYTATIFILTSLFLVLLSRTSLIHRKSFWLFQLALFALFFAANTFLTAIPIVEYSDQAIVGFRIGTIPIEDFLYNFVLINSFVLILTYRSSLNFKSQHL